MKRALLSVLLFIFFLAPILSASEIAPEGTAERKFQRGLINTAFSPLELTHALKKVEKTDTLIPSWILVFPEAAISTVLRVVAGAYDIITAPFPRPAEYLPLYGPRYEPELALELLPPLDESSEREAKK